MRDITDTEREDLIRENEQAMRRLQDKIQAQEEAKFRAYDRMMRQTPNSGKGNRSGKSRT